LLASKKAVEGAPVKDSFWLESTRGKNNPWHAKALSRKEEGETNLIN
jgi:hypothetical protein